ncbi:uncharacterized protein LOC753178 isoform X1 [Strongylocentrotus purpuratus]|uniref:Uncharacterized protein n=1 Tax=Strongylocentrotus purpuratus TaxID=7668 RepID=A0A7M7NPM5_STRPU|nr:uncharacterized protein LOC753178 isoform X1 [Strongylocentrotus purpuratus]XP_030839771.1 uncharacterized protein LOC753178 isoform X1 [Strongylocentrotus purpuratus]
MTTLAEARHTRCRERSFVGKPRKISSGLPLTRVQRVAHRSDILLDDQISLVKDTQDALEKAMLLMSSCKDPREQRGWVNEVDRLKLQCDEMLLILKVVRKLSAELLYAKVEVEQAAQSQGNVAAARKRVVWLEDRMEHLLGRYRNEFRLNSPLPIQPRFVTEKKTRPGAGRAGTHQTKRTNDSSRPKSILKPPRSHLTDDEDERDVMRSRGRERGQTNIDRPGLNRNHRRQRNDLRGLETDETQSTGDEAGGDGEWVAKQRLALRSRGRPGGAGERGTRGARGEQGGGGDVQGGRIQAMRSHQVGVDTEDEETDGSLELKRHPKRERGMRPGGGKTRNQAVEESSKDSSEDIRSKGRRATETEDDDEEDEEDEDEETVGELSTRSDLDEGDLGRIENGVFMTQESALSEEIESTRETASVSSVSKREDGAQGDDEKEEEDEEEVDEGAAYWESPHHKFEYNDHREAISRENPMSYHNLGLAVCSSFIEPAPEIAAELPWIPIKKGEQMSDVHMAKLLPLRPVTAKAEELIEGKVALDKIAERIHDIWGKMEDAADGAYLSHIDGSVGSARSSPIQMESRKPPIKGDKTRPQTKMSMIRARSVAKSMTEFEEPLPMPFASPPRTAISSSAPMLVYHPKPVPPPAVLPLTRTNHEKFYPRISNDWNGDDPDGKERSLRIVNQMNVAKETNLLVYKSKESKRKKSTKSALQKQAGGALVMRRWRNVAVANAMATAQISAFMGSKHQGSGKLLEKDEPRWKRVEHVLGMLASDRVVERRDAARHLGELDVIEDSVIEALTDRLDHDDDGRVRYEAARSLMSIGEWTVPVVKLIVQYLKEGSYQAKRDLVESMIKARGAAFISKTEPQNRALVETLKKICGAENQGDLGFDCAVCLGCLCVPDKQAKIKLMGSLDSKDINVTARSLEILVRQMHASEPAVVQMVLHQLQYSSAWKYRAAAAKLLVHIGSKCMANEDDEKMIFSIADKRLYDDPSREVRSEIANMMTSLGLKETLCELVEKRLFDEEDDERAHGVLAVGVIGMKSERIQRQLLEMLELDSCEYVRIQVIRTLADLGLTNIKVMRALKSVERNEGALSRESTKALKTLNAIKQRLSARSPRRTPSRSPSIPASSVVTAVSRKRSNTPLLKKVVVRRNSKSVNQSI